MIGLFLLALALATDAFAVAIVRGSGGVHSLSRALECGLVFGFAQGLMAVLGWALGTLFAPWIAAIDHWIAFGLLSLLGVRMIREAFAGLERGGAELPTRGSLVMGLAAAAIATSVDAAAAGLTLDLFGAPVWLACLVIGLVTAILCAGGYWFASRIGPRLGRFAEAAGGIVLIALGVKIVLEHMN